MKNKKGFTMIEMLIVLALLSAVGVLMYSVFGQGVRLYAEESKSANEQLNMRQALSDITNTARLVDPDSVSYASGVLNVGSASYTFADQSVKKNGTAIAKEIASFEVSISGGILNITITNLSGKSISTSLSLLG